MDSQWTGRWRGALLLAAISVVGVVTAGMPADYRFADDAPGSSALGLLGDRVPAVASDGVRYLVVADRLDLTGSKPAWHRQVSYDVVHERGLATAGQFSVEYQPAYQQVTLHAVDVWRNGQRLDLLRQSRVEVLRRESGLESGLTDGSRSLSVTIPDIRLQDRIEYRYTIHGYNPVFGRGYHDYWRARYGVPLGVREVSVVYPQSMSLHARADTQGLESETWVDGGRRWWRARGYDLARIEEEESTPFSHGERDRIEVSTAAGWGDVVGWALPLYPGRFTDRRMAAELATQLGLDRADPSGSLTRATAFVQGEVRYTGLDMGVNSHAPNAPETVAQRRFGDCKDKTQLLIALLHEAGIGAEPVLVHSQLREAVRGRLPSPLAFDHVIVRARMSDGDVWIDPTRDRERGPFASREPLAFGVGLVIGAGSDELVEIEYPFPDAPQIDVVQRLDFSGEGAAYRADFDVDTRYARGHADGMREMFSRDGAEEVGKRYLAYMQNYYEGLRSDKAPELADGEQSLSIQEQYRLQWDGEVDGSTFGIVLFQLLDWAPRLADEVRRTPLALSGPRFGRQTVHARHPDGWNIEPEQSTVENPYFRFHRSVAVDEGGALVIVAEWKRLSDEVPADEFARVRKDLQQVRNLLQFDVDLESRWPAFSRDPHDWMWPMGTVLLGGMLLACFWLLRDRWVLAGMLYKPRATVAARTRDDGLAIGLTIGLLAVVAEVALERGGAAMAAPSPFTFAALAGAGVAACVRWGVFAALLKFALRILGHRVPYGRMSLAYGMALAPQLVFWLLAMTAVGFRLHWLNDDSPPVASQLPALILAYALIVTGFIWWIVSLACATAGVAGVRKRVGMAAVAISVLPLLVLAIVVVAWLALR